MLECKIRKKSTFSFKELFKIDLGHFKKRH